MKKPITHVRSIVHLLAKPIGWLVATLRIVKRLHVKVFNMGFGTILLLTGAWLAHLQQHYMPLFVWDGLTYGIHGMGVAPIIKIVFDYIEVEI